MVADVNGNTPLHFFAMTAAEDSPKKDGEKKDDKDKKSKGKSNTKEKRHAAVVEALGCNLKCCNWFVQRFDSAQCQWGDDNFFCSNKVKPQDVVKAIQDKLDKFEKQRLQAIKTQGNQDAFLGMLLSSAKIEPLDDSFKETKKQLEKLTKLLK